MLNYIKKLQRKPEHVRRNVAFAVAIGVTVIVLVVWASTLDSRLALDHGGAETQLSGNAPISLLKEQGRIFVEGILEQIQSF